MYYVNTICSIFRVPKPNGRVDYKSFVEELNSIEAPGELLMMIFFGSTHITGQSAAPCLLFNHSVKNQCVICVAHGNILLIQAQLFITCRIKLCARFHGNQ